MPDWSIKACPSIVSPVNPMHFCTVVPELCWTTTYARCAAVALTHELAALAELCLGEPPHALTMPIAIRASVALVPLVPMRCLRTVFPPGGQPFPNALLKADRQELPCRCARTGLPLGVQVSWLADRYLSPPSRGPLPQWLFFGQRLPAYSCATAPVSHRIPLVPGFES